VAADLIGALLEGRYQVVERVAEGAMGVVYRGERVKLGRAVAIKFLHAWNAEDAAARKRFEVEARAMARLEHPNCAAVIDVGEYEGAPYVVMDYVRGTTLRDLLDEDRFSPARAADVAKQVLSGLAHAHELGIIHRDIKPANIMLSEKTGLGAMVKILDFGLARLRGGSGGLTVGIAIGTPSYMAPEQATGGPVDARTDLYACGVLLFEMLTGRKPFIDDDPLEVLRMHREQAPPRLAEVVPGEDFGALEEVVARALAKRPEDRFASAGELAAAIDGAMRSLSGAASGDGARAASSPPPAKTSGASLDGAATFAPAPPPGGVAAPTRSDPTRRRIITGAAIAGVALAAIGIIAAVLSAGGAHRAAVVDAAPVAIATDAGAPDSDVVARARGLADAGDVDGAIKLLDAARQLDPDRAALPYELGRLYFARMWWSDGVKWFRAAIRLDQRYRSDPELIKTVLRGFITTPDAEGLLASFLRVDIGAAAIPYLEETAQSHPNPRIRARAASLLQLYR
jgi:eukaryotic-like serine/threonine-protein kinase